jgi:hypothetical protein
MSLTDILQDICALEDEMRDYFSTHDSPKTRQR